jgi:hypothetical protein
MIRRTLSAGLVAALLLAGCGQGLAPVAASKAVRGLAAKDATDDAWEAVEHAARDAEEALALKGRLAAVLQNPTDMLMQRSLHIMYDQAMARALQTVDGAIDEQLGQGQTARQLQQTPECPNAQVQQYVQGIANRLTQAIGEKPFKTHVIMDDEENAANLGGHGLVVNFGLMTAARDEAEVAAVLGHEITHGLKRHVLGDIVREQLDHDFVQWVNDAEQVTPDDEAFVEGWTMLLTDDQKRDRDYVLGYLAGKVRPEMQKALIFRYNSYFAAQAFGRDAESAADVGGVTAIAAAKYDPLGMISLFDRWNDYAPADPRYHDHPTSGDRVGFIRSVIADRKLTGSDRGADRLAAIKPLLAGLKKPNAGERAGGPRKATLGTNPWVRKP